jgi:hypothetical protein
MGFSNLIAFAKLFFKKKGLTEVSPLHHENHLQPTG